MSFKGELHFNRFICQLLVGIFCFIALPALAQIDANNRPAENIEAPSAPGLDPYAEEGAPFVRYIPSNEYNQHFQNWWITQDARGMIYVANHDGVLEYDGTHWRLIETGYGIARSLDVSDQGTVFVGSQGDFGMIASDSFGASTYISLVPEALKEQGFADVWNTFAINDEVYFITLNQIFRYKNGKVETFATDLKLKPHLAFKVRGIIYLLDQKQGLMRIQNEGIVPVVNGEFFLDKFIFAMMPYVDRQLLIGTASNGLFLFDGINFMPFRTQIDSILRQEKIYHGISLPNEQFALALGNNGGTVVIDRFGTLVTVINKSTGVGKENATCLFVDREEKLWLALMSGLAIADIRSPFTHFSERNGVDGAPMAIERFKDEVYVGTPKGLLKMHLKMHPLNVAEFKKTIPEATDCSALLNFDNKELLIAGRGFFSYKDQVTTKIAHGEFNVIKRSKSNRGVVYAGLLNGLKLLQKTQNDWFVTDYMRGIDEEIRSIYETEDGNLWLGTSYQGVIHVDFNNLSGSHPAITKYGLEAGLPTLSVKVNEINNRPLFSTSEGLYKFDDNSRKFVRDYSILDSTFSKEPYAVSSIYEYENGDVYIIVNKTAGVARKKEDGSYQWDPTAFEQLRGFSPNKISPAGLGVLWYAVDDGLIRYNINKHAAVPPSFNIIISQVSLTGDSIIFGGNQPTLSDTMQKAKAAPHTRLAYDDNTLKFEFSALSYDIFSQHNYSFMLEGFDEGWSDWETSTSKEYTNLAEGDYVFRVKAQNIHGINSEEVSYAFTILPPVQRTWWFYSICVLLLVILFYLGFKVYSRQLIRNNRILEEKISERTKELEEKSLSLEKNNKRIEHQNAIIERKNKDITDSIRYAKRIQEAILPVEDDVKRVFADSFIYYKPRDIVSGDFYWYSYVMGRAVIVAGDCTGHGVPGAFMSMIGNDLLNQIVNDNKLTAPGMALNVLDKKLNYSLRKGEGESRDGMDVIMCAFDLENQTVNFAGAYRPLFLIRNGELIEYKTDKRSIGGIYRAGHIFKEQEIKLEKGDQLYMFSDGFVDQYGGPENRKFLSRNFKTLLLKYSHLTMSEQRIKIEEAFEDWKLEEDQIDDVLVMGIKV